MKKETMILVGAAGIAAYLVMQAGTKRGATTPLKKFTTGTSEILDAFGKRFSNGYRYFSDGVVIDPQGSYWKNNQMIWSPPAAKSSMSTTTDNALGDWTNEA